MWSFTFGNPKDTSHTTNLSDTVVFWLFGCVTIVIASRINLYLERRLIRKRIRRNRMRRRALGRRFLGPQIPEPRALMCHSQPWCARTMTPRTSPLISSGTSPSPCAPSGSPGLQTSSPGSPDRISGSTGCDRVHITETPRQFVYGHDPVPASQDTRHLRAGTSQPIEGSGPRDRSIERRRPAKRVRNARYNRSYVLDWLEKARAYTYG